MSEQLTIRPILTKADRIPLSIRIEELMTGYYISRGWEIDAYLAPMITLLSAYGANDPYFEDCELGQQLRLSLRKSLCISGTPGSSKTTLMEALNYALQQVGSPMAFAVHETKTLATAFENKNTGGLSAIKGILNGMVNRHIYYDEIGKKMIAEVRHYKTEANIDILVLEFREDLWRRGHFMTHSTTNMALAELEDWLTGKYISRFHQITNLIPYENATDYRMAELAHGGRDREPVISAEDKETKIREINVLIVQRLARELVSGYESGQMELSHETSAYYALVSLRYIGEHICSHTHKYFAEAMERARIDIQRRRSGLTDAREARRLRTLQEQMADGMALTTETMAEVTTAFHKVVLRHFIEERVPDAEAVYRVFGRVMKREVVDSSVSKCGISEDGKE